MPTLYATFNDADDAKRAAGALFDHGTLQSDLTITSKRVSKMRQNTSLDAEAEMSGENEGWPPLSATAEAADLRSLQEDQDDADESYREADDAEQSAKSGVSFTTPRDVIAGALKGAGVGLGLAAVVVLARLLPTTFGDIASVEGVLFVATLGLAAGALSGALLGLLKDQGASGGQFLTSKRSNITRRYAMRRPVTLAVDVSSGKSFEDEARRVVCKYHASSIDIA